MITVYLDHNVIDGFDKGKTAYLDPLLANKGVQPIISMVSVDEIFRGGDEVRSRRNIESLMKLGIRYIHSNPDQSHMSISQLDYENMHQKWLKIQSERRQLHDSHFLFISALYRGNTLDMDQAVSDYIAWIKNYYGNFPSLQPQMSEVLSNPQVYKKLCRQLLNLPTLLPFTPKEINNIAEKSVFWTCVNKLKSAGDPNLQLIGNFIEDEIKNTKTIADQFSIVFHWLNLFGYYPDDLTCKNKVRSNYSDNNHAIYAIACDGMLTLDNKFAKRAAAAMGALEFKTVISTDVYDLLHQIAALSSK